MYGFCPFWLKKRKREEKVRRVRPGGPRDLNDAEVLPRRLQEDEDGHGGFREKGEEEIIL